MRDCALGTVARWCGFVLALIGLVAMVWADRNSPAVAQTPPAASAPENRVAFEAARRVTLDALFAALAKAGDKYYFAVKEVKVTLGGCGG